MTALNKQALREKFEAWAEEAGALPWGHLKKQRTASGNYSVQIYTYMWHAWNACHEVFLDELEAEEKRIAEHNFENQLLANADRDIKALRQRIAELEARTPYGYLRQCDGQIQISIGSEQPHNRSGGYATPWFAIYTAAGIGVKGERTIK